MIETIATFFETIGGGCATGITACVEALGGLSTGGDAAGE